MEQLFSPGLLYSVAPENMYQLHLREDTQLDEVEWEEDDSQFYLLARAMLATFMKPAAR